MKVHSLHAHGTCFEPELFSNYSRIRNDAEQVFRKVCSAGFMLGAKYLTFHGPFIKYNRRIDVDYGKFCERLNELESIAESYGIQIAYENVNWAYFNTPDFFKTIKQNCPNVKATLDIKQAVLSDIDVHKYIDVMEDRLVTLHACGMDGKKPVMVGAGKINYDKLLSELSSTHPDLAIILEVYSNSFESLSELRAGYMKLCEIVNKAQ